MLCISDEDKDQSQARWCTPVDPELGRLRLEDGELRPDWAARETLSQNDNKKKKKVQYEGPVRVNET
jgi:hypothetical protein